MDKIPPIHPGEILKEEFLDPMNISQYKLAQAIKVPGMRINEIVRCKRSLSVDTALRLQSTSGILLSSGWGFRWITTWLWQKILSWAGSAKRSCHMQPNTCGMDNPVNVFETDWYQSTKLNMTPGDFMRAYRGKKGWTQSELGLKLGGIPKQHISNMERGTRAISLKMAQALATLFDTEINRFITEH